MKILKFALLASCLAVVLSISPKPCVGAISGVKYDPGTRHWYKRYRGGSGYTWSTAKSQAQSLGGYLATIRSSAESQWLVDNAIITSVPAYLGGTDQGSEGSWRWVNGESWSYTNWAPGCPTNNTSLNCLRTSALGNIQHWKDGQGLGLGGQGRDYIVEWNTDPNGGSPPPPPPPPPGSASDLSVGSVRFLPSTPSLGDLLEIDFRVQNAGPSTSGSIRATLSFVGYERSDDDGPLATKTLSGLGKGSSTSETMKRRITGDIPSGEYAVRVTAVPTDGPHDPNTRNNFSDATSPLVVQQPSIRLTPGEKQKLQIGPLGRQEFNLDAVEGLRGALKVKFLKAEGNKWLCRDGEASPFLEAEGKGVLKYKLTGHAAESLVLGIECTQRSGHYYTLDFKGKIKRKGELDIPPDGTDLVIPGYPGMTAAVTVKRLNGAAPRLVVADLGEKGKLKTSKKGAKVKKLVLEGFGPWMVKVIGEDGATGRCAWTIKVK